MAPQTAPAPFAGTLNVEGVPADAIGIAAAAYTTSQSVVFSPGGEHQCVEAIITSTAFGTSSNVPTIEAYNPATDSWDALITGAAIAANGQIVLRVGPTVTPVANLAAQRSLAPYMRVVMTAGNANASTYSVALRAS